MTFAYRLDLQGVATVGSDYRNQTHTHRYRGRRIRRTQATGVYDSRVYGRGFTAYFAYIENELAAALAEAQRDGTLRDGVGAGDLATALVVVVQGEYILSRSMDDPAKMDRAIKGAIALLGTARRP